MRKFDNNNHEVADALVLLTQIGVTAVVTVTICVVGGGWLDRVTGLSPLFTIIGFIIGAGGLFKAVMKQTAHFVKRKNGRGGTGASFYNEGSDRTASGDGGKDDGDGQSKR